MASSSDLSIVCQNVNGLGNKIKRAQIMAHLTTLKPDLIFLIDSRLGPQGQRDFFNDYPDYLFFFNSNSSNSRGVDILIHRRCALSVNSSWGDEDGNLLILDCSFDGDKFIFCALYGPNQDQPTFYQALWDRLNNYGTSNILIAGDWNVYQDPKIDSLLLTLTLSTSVLAIFLQLNHCFLTKLLTSKILCVDTRWASHSILMSTKLVAQVCRLSEEVFNYY